VLRMQRRKDENDYAIVICQSVLYRISRLVKDAVFFIFVIYLFYNKIRMHLQICQMQMSNVHCVTRTIALFS